MNDWKTLGLEIGAPLEEVKIAYRVLSKLHHPDVGGDSRMFVTVQLAYHRLEKQLTTPRVCLQCKGSGIMHEMTGFIVNEVQCSYCKGTGVICAK